MKKADLWIIASTILVNLAAPLALAQSAPAPVFFAAKLEPPAGRVLHGWGQFSGEWNKGAPLGAGDGDDLASYERAMAPYRPALLSFYTALDSTVMPPFGSRYENFVKERGFFVAQIGVYFQGIQRDVSQGMRDPEIVMVLDTIRETRNPVLLRIGYEFNNPWEPYDPSLYIRSFRHFADRINEARLDNLATVWNATPTGFAGSNFMRWYPGDDVVDWWGINLFELKDFDSSQVRAFLDAARAHHKPIVVSESSPIERSRIGPFVHGPKSEDEAVEWYSRLANLIHERPEIKAVVLISVNWKRLKSVLPAFGWPDTRIENWPKAAALWKKEVSEKRFVHASEAAAVYQRR